MDLGEHFRTVFERCVETFGEEEGLAVGNMYAIGVQRALDRKFCPRCQGPLSRKVLKSRVCSGIRESDVEYSCQACEINLVRIDIKLGPMAWLRLQLRKIGV